MVVTGIKYIFLNAFENYMAKSSIKVDQKRLWLLKK